MSTSFLLETYAKRLRLPAMKRVYKEIAHDASERQIPYEEFLLALLEQEVQQRDANQIASRIKHAKFPSMKTLDQFEFSAIPSLNKPKLLQSQSQKRILQLERPWLKTDLIILDEVGFVPLSRTGAELLFQFCAARYEKGSMIITSNLEFTEWTQIFKDEQMTSALVDRLTHRAHIFPMNGDSYRFKQSIQRS